MYVEYVEYGVYGLPEAFFLGAGLAVDKKFVGALEEDDFQEPLDELAHVR